jgi:hypothetical protein
MLAYTVGKLAEVDLTCHFSLFKIVRILYLHLVWHGCAYKGGFVMRLALKDIISLRLLVALFITGLLVATAVGCGDDDDDDDAGIDASTAAGGAGGKGGTGGKATAGKGGGGSGGTTSAKVTPKDAAECKTITAKATGTTISTSNACLCDKCLSSFGPCIADTGCAKFMACLQKYNCSKGTEAEVTTCVTTNCLTEYGAASDYTDTLRTLSTCRTQCEQTDSGI